jgi:uncharacterized protein
MTDKNKLLLDLKARLQEQFPSAINHVVLFGSQANNNANEFSDYDVLILLNNDYTRQDEDRILDICYDMDLKYNILIDVHLLSVREMNSLRGKQPIFANAIKNGIYA